MISHKRVFDNHFIMLGFGSIGKAVLPLLFNHIQIQTSQITIISEDDTGKNIASEYGVSLQTATITPKNYTSLLCSKLCKGDVLINLTVNVSSEALIALCQQHGALYIDAAIESWPAGYLDSELHPALRTHYMLRESLLKLKKGKGPTAVITHGANPGLVSHFVKQALLNIAEDNELTIHTPQTASEWAYLAYSLNIKAIHIAERDTQITACPKAIGECVNTWSVDAFLIEASLPAELGWGTHEQHWPSDAEQHDEGSKCAIYLNRPGASTLVRTWTPSLGAFHGFLITHAESVSIANYFTLTDMSNIHYRPTVHYAYSPCPDAKLSLLEFKSSEWHHQQRSRLIFNDIVEGSDELGVLLMGNQKGAYWFGSHLSIHEARKQAPYNNATSLQVAAGVLSGIIWAIEHPEQGIVEPEEMSHQFILDVAKPYLGNVAGYYTDWTPLQNRELLFPEKLDVYDPWQFLNIRVE